MTVQLLGPVNHYAGVAADVKPTTGVPVGSTFYETDTRIRYVYTAAGWGLLVDAVGGAVAAGAADFGNPVKVGGLAATTSPGAVSAGQRTNASFDIYGRQQVAIATNTGTPGSDGVGIVVFPFEAGTQTVSGSRPLVVAASVFNGTSWDRLRGNAAATGLASAARTASTPTPDQTNYNGRGAQITLDVTATPNDAQTLQVTVEVKDSVSGKYVQIAAFTALTASVLGATPTAETYVYTLYPGAAETIATAKHELQALPLGRTWRVNVLHSAGGSWAYSVGIVNLA